MAIVLGIAPAAMAEDTIKIGTVTPNTGGMAQSGNDLARSYELAADRINAEGGVLGKKLVIIRGAASTANEGISAVEQLVGREKVDLLIGTIVTAIANSASDSAMNYGKLYWETSSLSNDLTDRGLPNFARTGPSGADFAKRSVQAAIDLVAKKLGKQPKDFKVWIENEDSAYGTTIANEQERLFKEAGVQVFHGTHSARSIDLTDAVFRAKGAAPDLWLQTDYVVDANLLLKTAKEQGFKPPAIMIVGVGDTTETLNAIGKENLEGILLVSYPRAGENEAFAPGAAAFAEAFAKKYGSPPLTPSGMTGYVGLRILAEAIKAAGSTDSDKVIKAAAAMDKPEGSYETGYGVKFDDKMQNTRALPIVAQWQNGKVIVVYPPAAAPAGVSAVNLARE